MLRLPSTAQLKTGPKQHAPRFLKLSFSLLKKLYEIVVEIQYLLNQIYKFLLIIRKLGFFSQIINN